MIDNLPSTQVEVSEDTLGKWQAIVNIIADWVMKIEIFLNMHMRSKPFEVLCLYVPSVKVLEIKKDSGLNWNRTSQNTRKHNSAMVAVRDAWKNTILR